MRAPALPELTYYQASAGEAAAHPPLQGRHEVEVGIVGGGFAGLATAMGLLERGQPSVAVLEAQQLGHGASGRNGGFVFGGYSLEPQALVAQHGLNEARALYQLTLQAVATIRQRIAKHGIAADVTDGGALLAHWFRNEAPLRAQMRFMNEQMRSGWQWLGRSETRKLLHSERYHAALFEPQAFHFHPLRYARGLGQVLAAAGVGVHERSAALSYQRQGNGWLVRTAQGQLHCRELVLCCGGYFGRFAPNHARAVLPIATYVMATEPLGEQRLRQAVASTAAIYDTRFAFDYYRALPDTRLLWGGRISVFQRSPQAVARLLMADLLKVYPQLAGVQITHAWGGLMSYARHSMPQLGQGADGAWHAMGFGGHGVAPTTAVGELLAAHLVEGQPLPAALQRYGTPSVHGWVGLAAAQARYAWYQALDAGRSLLPPRH